MRVSEFCKIVPEIGRHIQGLNPQNALEYIGRESDKCTKKDLETRDGEVDHNCYWGGKVSDRLKKVNDSLFSYTQAHRDRLRNMKGHERNVVEKNLVALQLELARLLVAMRIAQYVHLTGSDDLPDPPNDNVDLGNGLFKPALYCADSLRIPRLKAWAGKIYRDASIMGASGSAAPGLQLIADLEGKGEAPEVEKALTDADAKPKGKKNADS